VNKPDRTRTIFLIIIGIAIVVVIGFLIIEPPLPPDPESTGETSTASSESSSTTSSEGSTEKVEILMLTADTKAEWVKTVTESFNAAEFETPSGKTIFVEVMEQDSPGDARDAILNGSIQPAVWSPGDMSWVEQANQVSRDRGIGPLVKEDCPRIVYAATGFAMWLPMAEAMGWPDTPIGWDDIVELATDPKGWSRYGHPEWGQFKFGHTHPEHSTTGFALLANLVYASLDITSGLTPELVKSDEVVEAFRTVELNTFHYGTSTRELMNQMAAIGPSYLHAVSASETAVLANNKYVPYPDDKRFPYVFIFPAEGTFWSDNPFCIMDTDWVSDEQREAALVYKDYLLAPEQQDVAIDIGLRPANPDVSLHDPISLEYYTDSRVSPDTVPPLESVSDEVHDAIVDLFEQTKKKATIIVALDRSQSMAEENKITAAINGTKFFLNALDREDEIQLLLFNDTVTSLQPLAPAGTVVETLNQQLDNVWPEGNTALYDVICQAQELIDEAKAEDEASGENRLYGVVVLSDGEDTNSSKTESDMFRCLPSGEDVVGVKVFTIAYGDDADEDLLLRIANRTNGKTFAGDPNTIEEIYLEISAEQ
jgi:Ca-activated chloride channel family protein